MLLVLVEQVCHVLRCLVEGEVEDLVARLVLMAVDPVVGAGVAEEAIQEGLLGHGVLVREADASGVSHHEALLTRARGVAALLGGAHMPVQAHVGGPHQFLALAALGAEGRVVPLVLCSQDLLSGLQLEVG